MNIELNKWYFDQVTPMVSYFFKLLDSNQVLVVDGHLVYVRKIDEIIDNEGMIVVTFKKEKFEVFDIKDTESLLNNGFIDSKEAKKIFNSSYTDDLIFQSLERFSENENIYCNF